MDDKPRFLRDGLKDSSEKIDKSKSSKNGKDKKTTSQPFVVPDALKKQTSEDSHQSTDTDKQKSEESTPSQLENTLSLKESKDDITSSPETSKSSKESPAEVPALPSSSQNSDASESPKATKESTNSQKDDISESPVDTKTDQKDNTKSSDKGSDKSSPESTSTQDNKDIRRPSYFQKKRESIVTFFTGKSPEESKKEEEGSRPKRQKRPSFVKRKMLALEKELTMDNINKKVTGIFVPEYFKKSQQKEEIQSDGKEKPAKTRLSSAMACLFLVGATTGSAMPSLPFFLKQSSWFGVFLNLLLGFNSLYAGLCAGWCWTIMEERWPEYLDYSRIPYQDIAYRAVGTWMKYIVAICIDISLIGSCASCILLMADSMEKVIQENLEFCYLLIIIIGIIMPFVMFGSFNNVKFIGVCDILFSVLFTVILTVAFFLDKPSHGATSYTDPSFDSVVLAFAGFSFAYGSGAVLPSILSDMEDRDMFTHSCVTAYMISMALYMLLPIIGYAAYGDDTPHFVLERIYENDDLYILGLVIDFIHVLQMATTFIIALFPTLHAFEVRLNCPDRFGCFRFMVRVIIVVLILVLILGWPDLPKTMAIVGATTLNLATFIFPPVFYVCLVYRQKQQKKRHISKKMWLLIVETVILGIIVGVLSTYVAVNDFRASSSVRMPCYLNMTAS